MHIANGAPGKTKAVGGGRQLFAGNQIGCFIGVEGDRQFELAVPQHAVHLRRTRRKGLATPPQAGMQLVQISPQRLRGRGKCDWCD